LATRRPPRGDHQLDLFIACFTDIAFRDHREMMERPFFSLSKSRREDPIEYRVGETWVRVTPPNPNLKLGMATIWDADVLIWAVSQLIEARDSGMPTSPALKLHPYELLKAIRRGASGSEYRRLRDALQRLTHTAVETSIRADEKKSYASFHWLDSWNEVVDTNTKKPLGITFTLPRWLYLGILEQGAVLTIDEDYFLLTGGLERWLYRVARKHAGHQEAGWQFTMHQLYDKSGSLDRFSKFAFAIRRIVTADKLPGYALELNRNGEGDEIVYLIPREHLSLDDPRYKPARLARRRIARGIYSHPLQLP
jgi:plasmid replication initiation protein